MKYTEFASIFDEKCVNNGVFCDNIDKKVDMYLSYIFLLSIRIPKYEVKSILYKIQSGDVDHKFVRNMCAERGMEMTPSEVKWGLVMYEVALEEMLEKLI